MPLPPMPEYLTTSQMGALVGVSGRTMRRWIQGGRLQAWQTNGRHCRVPISEALAFCASHKIALPSKVKAVLLKYIASKANERPNG